MRNREIFCFGGQPPKRKGDPDASCMSQDSQTLRIDEDEETPSGSFLKY